jgi:hypothetical protein
MASMRDRTDPSRAMVREFFLALAALVLGFAGAFALGLYLLVRYAIPEHGWWSIADALHLLLALPLLTGMICAAAVLFFRLWLHAPRRMEVLWQALLPVRGRRSLWRHYRRQFPLALRVFVLMLVVAAVFAPDSRGPNPHPYLYNIFLGHVLICGLVAVVGELAQDVARYFGWARRFRLRMTIVQRILAVWGVVGMMVIVSIDLISKR